jgi:HAD superfamily hydrolase (TIGR01509 family)
LDIAHRRLPGVRQDLAFVGAISQQEYRTEILRSYGVTRPAEIERGLQIIAGEDEDLEFFPGVPETLKELKARGYLLGIVTDTAASISAKLRWFERGGFGNVWDTVISSLEIQARKPDPRIYQAALCQLGLAAQQAVFVGHKISELDGARAVGMHTVAFNYEQDAAAEYYIERFGGLLDVPLIVGGIAA